MDTRTIRAALYAATSLMQLAITIPSFAAEQDPATVKASPQGVLDGGSSSLEDIVVTARKRTETAQSVPVSVTAISAATITRNDLTSIEKIAARTPQLSVGRSSNGAAAQITMRGIGSSSTSIGIEQSVATVVDGVYYGQGRILNEGFFDLGGVEILKGPQALFFGKNATAGVISLQTADPTTSLTAKAVASYEIKGEVGQVEAVVSGPLTDTLGFRVAGRGSKQWGYYYKNVNTVQSVFYGGNNFTAQPSPSGPGGDEMMARATLKWDPTSDFTATLKASGTASDLDNSSYNYVAFNCGRPDGFLQVNSAYRCSDSKFISHGLAMAPEVSATYPYAGPEGKNYNRYRSLQTTLNLQYRLDDINLTSVTNYNWNNNRYNCPCDFQTAGFPVYVTENSSWRAFSQEVRALTTYDSPVNVMVGMLYQKTKRDFFQAISFGVSDNGPASGQERFLDQIKVSQTNGETISGFGQVIWKILPDLEATAGVRYTHETKKSFFNQPFVSPAFQAVWNEGIVTTGDQTFNNWSPDATLSWKAARDVMIYGSYKTAYKSGGFSNGGIDSKFGNASVDLLFNPETVSGFEAGIKSELLDRQLRLNLNLYTYKYKDLQVDFFNSAITAFQTLTADARTKGVELEFEFAPRAANGLNIHGSINYNRARYTSFSQAPCYAGQTPGQGCLLIAALGGYRQNLDRVPLAIAPNWVGGLGVSYDGTLANGMSFGLNVDSRYSGSYIASGFGAPQSRQSRYALLDAGIHLGSADKRWELAILGKNLTNRLFVAGALDGPSTGTPGGVPPFLQGDQFGFGNIPRTVRLQLTVQY